MADTTGNPNTIPGNGSPLQFAGSAEQKLVFSGPPSAVEGRVPLVNTTNEKQKLRTLTVSATDLRGPAQIPLREFPVAARIGPGEQASVPLSIQLDPQTKPGTYDLELNVAGKAVPATVYVTEVVDLRLQPDNITILVGAKTTYTRQLTAQNLGNVALPLGARCETPLFDAVDLGATMLVGLAKASGERDVVKKVGAWLQEWGDTVAGTLVVTRDAVTLQAGQTFTGEVKIEVPANLKPLHRYRAPLQLFNATVVIELYTTAKAGSAANKRRE